MPWQTALTLDGLVRLPSTDIFVFYRSNYHADWHASILDISLVRCGAVLGRRYYFMPCRRFLTGGISNTGVPYCGIRYFGTFFRIISTPNPFFSGFGTPTCISTVLRNISGACGIIPVSITARAAVRWLCTAIHIASKGTSRVACWLSNNYRIWRTW